MSAADVKPGDTVRYWPGARTGPGHISVVERGPFPLGGPGGTPVVYLTRTDTKTHHDCIALTHIEVLP